MKIIAQLTVGTFHDEFYRHFQLYQERGVFVVEDHKGCFSQTNTKNFTDIDGAIEYFLKTTSMYIKDNV